MALLYHAQQTHRDYLPLGGQSDIWRVNRTRTSGPRQKRLPLRWSAMVGQMPLPFLKTRDVTFQLEQVSSPQKRTK